MTKKQSNKIQSLKIPRSIILYAKFLQLISMNLATKFAAKLFTTPLKHTLPKRELEMDQNSTQETILIPEIKKHIVVYHYGTSPKKVLLVHGWSGRGTQLVKFADELLKLGYSTISFDAPAHGKSGTKTTLMPEFIASILELEKRYGPFDYALGHSLGGMSLLNAVKRGLKIKRLVIIGSGDIIEDITKAFVKQLALKPIIAQKMRDQYEKQYGVKMENYSAHIAAQEVQIPTLVVHDQNDVEVPFYCAKNIYKHLPNGELLITKKLGHRKILGEATVIKQSLDFLLN